MNRIVLTALACLIAYRGAGTTRYVDVNCRASAAPYTSWPTAGTNIQQVIDACWRGDIVLVTNGIYDTGGKYLSSSTNRVAITSAITVRSINGPHATIIRGHQIPGTIYGPDAVRCVCISSPGALLSGFTVREGTTIGDMGGGIYCTVSDAVISNCTLTANAVSGYGGGIVGGTAINCTIISNTGVRGGGACSTLLKNCSVVGNVATTDGGGTYMCSMGGCFVFGNTASGLAGGCLFGSYTNCTIVENSAGQDSGGTYRNDNDLNGRLYNCIVYYNHAPLHSNCSSLSAAVATNCCITPVPTNGTFNITNAPLFINAADGNYRLQSNSPCIDVGDSRFTNFSSDLDGRPRVVNGTVDLGAYEFQGPNQGEFFQWLQHNGLNTDGSDDYTDPDGDGFANWNEWRAGTDPADRNSALRVLNAQPDSLGTRLTWQSVPGKSYSIERSTSVIPLTFQTVGTHVPGAASSQAYTDTTATNEGPYLYRVRVE